MRKILAVGLLLFSILYYHGNGFATNTLKALFVASDSPVELILTDPLGRRTGFDPATHTWFEEIPSSDYRSRNGRDYSVPGPPMKDLSVTNQMAGQYTLDVIGTGSGDFSVEVTTLDAGHMITHYFQGTTAPGVSFRFTFQGEVIVFASFKAHLVINSASKAFEMNGTFTLGPGGTISPGVQPVTIELGFENFHSEDFSVTIPAGSFRRTPQGTYVFAGIIDHITLGARLTPTDGDGYAVEMRGTGTPDLPRANSVEVQLAIGNNGGSVSVNADFARSPSGGRLSARQTSPRPAPSTTIPSG